nr:MAG TPA: Cro/C1-type HTH DNA-binding domain protein [Caudoviricetes sp.]
MHKSGGFPLGTLYENITSLCAEHGIKGGKMCVELGISKSLMTKLRDNPARQITSETAKKIADYFGVSVERVLTGEKEQRPANSEALVSSLPENIQALIKICRANPELASALLLVAQQIQNGSAVQE